MVGITQVLSEAIAWHDEIAKSGPVCYLINSEPDGDHISGNYFIEGTVVGHDGNRNAILNAAIDQMKESVKTLAPVEKSCLDNFLFRPHVITYSDRLTLYQGDQSFQFTHLPGHPPYQTAVFMPEQKVVMGHSRKSEFFSASEAIPFEWFYSLNRVQQLGADLFNPGHGVICEKSYLPEVIALLQDHHDSIQAATKGSNVEEAQEKIVFHNKYPIPKGAGGDDPEIAANEFCQFIKSSKM